MLIFDSLFILWARQGKNPQKKRLLRSPCNSRKMVRPHPWRYQKEGPVALLRRPYEITNGGMVLGAFFATFLL